MKWVPFSLHDIPQPQPVEQAVLFLCQVYTRRRVHNKPMNFLDELSKSKDLDQLSSPRKGRNMI